MTEERSESIEVDWLSKQDTTTAIIAVFGTIAAVFLALAVIRTVLYCLKCKLRFSFKNMFNYLFYF